MSIKSGLAAAATALTLIAGVDAAGTLTANAATPRCGPRCTELYSRAFGPVWVLNVVRHVGRAGQLTTLARASRANQGEDFIVDRLGRVRDFFRAGLISGGLNARYGRLSAYEIEYTPNGVFSGLCLGVRTAPGAGTPVVLEPCGVNAKTVWIFEPVKTRSGTFSALISAATNRDFRHPYSLTALVPRFPLTTEPLTTTAHGPALAHQLWKARRGVLPGSPTR
jgi:hypothetical protein